MPQQAHLRLAESPRMNRVETRAGSGRGACATRCGMLEQNRNILPLPLALWTKAQDGAFASRRRFRAG
jgi:hypothetical protein